jgi:PadR family transcriptional regulator PadR
MDGYDAQRLGRSVNELLVLATLRRGRMHGYQIAQELGAATGGVFAVQHGTLYPVLHRLESQRLIAGEWVSPAGERRRRVYAITPDGAAHLASESHWLRGVFGGLFAVIEAADGAVLRAAG